MQEMRGGVVIHAEPCAALRVLRLLRVMRLRAQAPRKTRNISP